MSLLGAFHRGANTLSSLGLNENSGASRLGPAAWEATVAQLSISVSALRALIAGGYVVGGYSVEGYSVGGNGVGGQVAQLSFSDSGLMAPAEGAYSVEGYSVGSYRV